MTLRNYTRWRQTRPGLLHADILGAKINIAVDTTTGTVLLNEQTLSPDEARMIGVRLIDGAVLADADRAIRTSPDLRPAS